MSIALLFVVLAWCTFAVSGDLARCTTTERNIDNSFSDCGAYGYDATWIVSTKGTVSETSDDLNYITVNGVWPPPTIKVKLNQRIRINLINKMPNNEPVTLHFHGLLQENGYVTMDGPQGVVQTGVTVSTSTPDSSFIYDFPARQAGTFWVHSHAPGQYPKGLRSPLIVTDDTEPGSMQYDADLDITTSVSDWWPNFWKTEAAYKNNNCGNGLEVPPANLTINDKIPGSTSPTRYVIPPNKTARLRIINTSAFAQFYVFDADGRPFTVVELDGVKVSGSPVKGFSISSGQRISVLLKGNSNAAGRIYFISEPRVAGGSSSCKLTPTSSDQGALAQFTTLYTTGDASNSVTLAPVLSDFDHTKADGTVEPRRWLKTWIDCVDDWATPYYSSRLKVPMGDDARSDTITKCSGTNPRATGVHAPKDVFGFADVNFKAADGTAAWKVPQASTNYIHMISIQDHKASGADLGRGEMGSTIYTLTPDSLFKLPDSYNARTKVSGLPPPTTLQWILQKENYAEVAKKDPKSYQDGGSGAQTLVLPTKDEVHWLVIRTTRGDHPIHLHGHEFQILARKPAGTDTSGASKNFQDDPVVNPNDANGWQTFVNNIYNAASTAPVRRDTIMIERGWTYVLAIKASNPGVWALHCHNDFHASTGMFMQVVEAPLDLRKFLGTWSYAKTDGANPTCPNSLSMSVSTLGVKNTPAGGAPAIWDPFYQLMKSSLSYWGYGDACIATTTDSSYKDQ